MALTDAEIVILIDLLYSPEFVEAARSLQSDGVPPTVEECINEIRGEDGAGNGFPPDFNYFDEAAWDDLLDTIADSPLASLQVYDVDSYTERGSVAACFIDPNDDGQPYVLFMGTGTEKGVASEWETNAHGLYEVNTDPQIAAIAYVNSIHFRTGKDLVIGGHSNGGNKAESAALACSHVIRCVSLDGQGFGPEAMAYYAAKIEEKKDIMVAIRAEGDYVSALLNSIAGVITYRQATRLGPQFFHSYLMNHSPEALSGDDWELGEEGARSPAATEIELFTVWLGNATTHEDRVIMGTFLGKLLDATMGSKQQSPTEVIMQDPEGMGLVIAYMMEYPRLGDLLVTLLAEILVSSGLSDVSTEGDVLIILGARFAISTLLATLEGAFLVLLLVLFGTAGIGAVALLRFFEGVLEDLAGAVRDLLLSMGFSEQFLLALRDSVERGRRQIRARGAVGDGGGVFASTVVRDFSDAKLEEILALVREVDTEPVYDVRRWNEWYRGERFFRRLDIDRHVDDIEMFRRQIRDVTDTTEGSVRRIFESARARDATFAHAMDTVRDNLSAAREGIRSIRFYGG